MAALNVSLVVAAYRDDASAAAEDFQTIKGLDDTYVVAAVVLTRDSAGKVEVTEHGGGLVASGTTVGAVAEDGSGSVVNRSEIPRDKRPYQRRFPTPTSTSCAACLYGPALSTHRDVAARLGCDRGDRGLRDLLSRQPPLPGKIRCSHCAPPRSPAAADPLRRLTQVGSGRGSADRALRGSVTSIPGAGCPESQPGTFGPVAGSSRRTTMLFVRFS